MSTPDARWLAYRRVRDLHEVAGGVHAPLADLAGFTAEVGEARWPNVLRAWTYYCRRGVHFEAPDPPSLARFRKRVGYWVRQAGPPTRRGWGQHDG